MPPTSAGSLPQGDCSAASAVTAVASTVPETVVSASSATPVELPSLGCVGSPKYGKPPSADRVPVSQPVAAVAAAVGYESEPAFNRAFTRATGMPPAAWRRAAAGHTTAAFGQ